MRVKWQNWIWLPVALLAGAIAAKMNLPQFEPITGLHPSGALLGISLFVATSFGVGIFLVFKQKWYWKIVSSCFLLIGFAFMLPLPSKAGVSIYLANQTGSELNVIISRASRPECFVEKALPAHSETVYRTAPGEYSESLTVRFQIGSNFLDAAIFDLRKNKVMVSSGQMSLQPILKS